MTGYVVDENVLRTANGEATHASLDCQLAAVDFLMECYSAESLVLDDLYRILTLYAAHCSHSGQPGTGDFFMVWARDNLATLQRAHLEETADGGYSSFPTSESLSSFDWDDRVYVATALAASPTAALVNAVDSDYSEHAEALKDAGLDVKEICPDHLHNAERASR